MKCHSGDLHRSGDTPLLHKDGARNFVCLATVSLPGCNSSIRVVPINTKKWMGGRTRPDNTLLDVPGTRSPDG